MVLFDLIRGGTVLVFENDGYKGKENKMKALLDLLAKLELSLGSHSSMNEDLNPVLHLFQSGNVLSSSVESVLAQYSLLPAHIVEFLSAGSSRLQEWASVKAELERNIGEEMGSRTEGLSHYAILKRGLRKELCLDVSHVEPLLGTRQFLHSIESALSNEPKPFVAGILYGLEASAVPELTIVAKIVNEYARIIELNEPIDLSGMHTRARVEATVVSEKYSLNTFFASHLWDFEIGHKKGLASTLIKDFPSSSVSVQSLESGFEFVLSEMDRWWDSLADTKEDSGVIQDRKVIQAPTNLLA